MNKKFRIIFVILFICSTVLCSYGYMCSASDDLHITYAENPELIFDNPEKGWIHYTGGLTDKTCSYAKTGYHRYTWTELEPAEGQYNWNLIDNRINTFAKYGVNFAFGISPGQNPPKSNTPDWVFDDAGAKYVLAKKGSDKSDNPETFKSPVCSDSIWLEKYDNFLAALAERYDNDSRVEYIDARLWGTYGEGHNVYAKPVNDGDELYVASAEDQRKIFDLYVKNFKKVKIIALAFNHPALYPYMEETNVGYRTDSVLNPTHDMYPKADKYMLGPVVFESASPYKDLKANIDNGNSRYWNTSLYYYNVLSFKPSYMDMGQWGTSTQLFVEEQSDIIKNLTNKMGYHFVLKNAVMPRCVAANEDVPIDMIWENKGVNYLFANSELKFALLDSNGNVVEEYSTKITPTRKWKPGADAAERANIKIGDVADGDYYLGVGILKYGSETPDFRIGNYGRTDKNWYIIADAKKINSNIEFSYDRSDVYVNDTHIQYRDITRNGSRFLPINDVFGALDASVSFKDNCLWVDFRGKNIKFDIAADKVLVDGVEKISSNSVIDVMGSYYFNDELLDVLPLDVSKANDTEINDYDYNHKSKDIVSGIIRNGGFEVLDNSWSYDETYFSVTPDGAYEGKNALKANNAEAEKSAYQLFSVDNVSFYNLSFYVNTDFDFKYKVILPDGNVYEAGTVENTNGAYKKINIQLNYADPGMVAINVPYKSNNLKLVFETTGLGGSAYVDGVSMQKTGTVYDFDPEGDLFADYGMEAGYTPWVLRYGARVELTREAAHSGQWSIKNNPNGDTYRGIVNDITDVLKKSGPGKYRFELYGKNAAGASEGLMRFSIHAYNEAFSKSTEKITDGEVATSDTDWAKLEGTFEITQEQLDNGALFMAFVSNGDKFKNIMYFDDISLVKID